MASKIRDRIVNKAVQCFAKKGYHGCSTKEIAEKANVTEGSLFRLFASKEKLFNESLTVTLAAKKIRKQHLRIMAFGMLETKITSEANRKALLRLASRFPLIRELRAISR